MLQCLKVALENRISHILCLNEKKVVGFRLEKQWPSAKLVCDMQEIDTPNTILYNMKNAGHSFHNTRVCKKYGVAMKKLPK